MQENIDVMFDMLNQVVSAFRYVYVVDIFSFKPPIRHPFDSILTTLQHASIPVISIDIPSGNNVKIIEHLLILIKIILSSIMYQIF